MRKSLIQTAVMWEYALENFGDSVRDDDVRFTYRSYFNGPPNPTDPQWDSSTGPGQVFAATAIRSHNWARPRNLSGEPERDTDSKVDMWNVWQRLNTSIAFNIETVALVLLKGAFDAGLDVNDALDYDLEDVEAILTQYNGGADYGDRNKHLYEILEGFNDPARS